MLLQGYLHGTEQYQTIDLVYLQMAKKSGNL